MTRSRAGTWSSISLTRLADQMQRAAAAGAGLVLDIEPDVLAGQVRRQARPLALRLGRRRSCGRKRKLGFDPCEIDVEVFEAELQLVVIEPLGAPAELAALQLLDDEVEPFDLGLRLAEAGALGRERAHHPLQRLHIVRQGSKIDVHETQSLADSRRSHRSTCIIESIGRSDHPAMAGRHRCSGARQSTPSISSDSCAEVSDSVSPGSTLGGHRKTPCSSRLVNRHSPVPSQKTILMRLALVRPRNTNRWPVNGSCCSTPCTSMARPSMPLRMSM